MGKTDGFDLALAAVSVLAAVALVYVSLEHLPHRYYLYVRNGSAVSLAACSLFFFRRVASDSHRRAAIVLAIASAGLAAVFLFHKGPRAEWIDIDRGTAAFLLAPMLSLFYERFNRSGKAMNFENVRNKVKELELLPRALIILFWAAVIGGIYWFNTRDGDSEYDRFVEMGAQKQIVELPLWSDYTGRRWLSLNENGTYKIETGKLSDDSMKTVTIGDWRFDPATNILTLSSAGSEERLGYMLQSEQAFLGGDPVEGTPLGKVWFSIVPSPK